MSPITSNPSSQDQTLSALVQAVNLLEAAEGITSLTGDVTASGVGSVAATAVKIPPGVTLTGTPSAGQIPTATGAAAATWQAPAQPKVKSVSATYAALATDGTIFYSGVMDGTQGITLPSTGLTAGQIMRVKVTSTDASAGALNVNSGNAAEWAGNPQLFAIPTGTATGGTASFQWDGSAWWLLSYTQ